MEVCDKEVALGLVFHEAQCNSGGSQGAFHFSLNVWLHAECCSCGVCLLCWKK